MHSWQNTEQALKLLAHWQQQGLLSSLDGALGTFIAGQGDGESGHGALPILVALLSYQVSRGHVCLPLQALLDNPVQVLGIETGLGSDVQVTALQNVLAQMKVAELESILMQSPAVYCRTPVDPQAITEPVIYSQGALYLSRFWRYEQRISANLRARMQSGAFEAVPVHELSQLLDELFAVSLEPSAEQTDAERIQQVPWQKLACANTLRSRFSVITGGPGTGKTYTVVRLLAMLQRLAGLEDNGSLKICLAAPTGKAAARLKSSLQSALAELRRSSELASWQPIFAQLESDSETIHKLLGTQQRSRKFRHDASNPLNLDVLVVDEASMVDIELMDALLDALPKHAQLILLGDKDQLASVEAGAILGQLCQQAEQGRYQASTFDYLQAMSPVSLPRTLYDEGGPNYLQHLVMLRVSRRFDEQSGIGHLARAINRGNGSVVSQLLRSEESAQYSDVHMINGANGEVQRADTGRKVNRDEPYGQLWQQLRDLTRAGFRLYWEQVQMRPGQAASDADVNTWATNVLKSYSGFQLLAAVREGEFGVNNLNTEVAAWLDFIPKEGLWYEGRPVMVTENDYSLNLRNGDIGITLKSPKDNALRVVFIDTKGHLRWILPSRLRHVQTVFAMTVHKSQGSEFAHTVMVLPPNTSPILSRELVYTGVTRASQRLTMVLPEWQVLIDALDRPTVRAGHLNI